MKQTLMLFVALLVLAVGSFAVDKESSIRKHYDTSISCHVGPDGCTYCSTHNGPVRVCPPAVKSQLNIDGLNLRADGSDPMPLCRPSAKHVCPPVAR